MVSPCFKAPLWSFRAASKNTRHVMPCPHGTAFDGEYLLSHRLQTPVVIYILGLDSKPMALTIARATPGGSLPSPSIPTTTSQRCLPIRHPWSLLQLKDLRGCTEALKSAPNPYSPLVPSAWTVGFAGNHSSTGAWVVPCPIPAPAASFCQGASVLSVPRTFLHSSSGYLCSACEKTCWRVHADLGGA